MTRGLVESFSPANPVRTMVTRQTAVDLMFKRPTFGQPITLQLDENRLVNVVDCSGARAFLLYQPSDQPPQRLRGFNEALLLLNSAQQVSRIEEQPG